MQSYEQFRAGYVALVGRPNAGKSTLLNQLLNQKLSIVTQKPQTTRKTVLGIYSTPESQMVFIDTPGLIRPRYNLQTVMMEYVANAIKDADVVLYLADVSATRHDFEHLENKIGLVNRPVLLLLNKIDLVNKSTLLPLIDKYQKVYPFASIIPISAKKGEGMDLLLKEISKHLPVNPPYFPPEFVTDQPERFFVSEIIREKIFQLYGEEVPYSCHVQIEDFREREGRKDYIRAVIFVEKISQKGILIGKGGMALKKVGEQARAEIEDFLQRPVYLELHVKVMEAWRKNKSQLKRLGF